MKFLITFTVSMCMFAGLAWIAGYNFDQRGLWVAYTTLVAIGVSIIVGVFAELP